MASDLASALAAGKHALSEPEAKALLEGFGVVTPRSAVASSAEGLASAAADLSPPLAVKVVSAEGAHKSDVGGVRLNLEDAAAVEAAVQTMPTAEAYLIEEMASNPPNLNHSISKIDLKIGKVWVAEVGHLDGETYKVGSSQVNRLLFYE